MMKKAASRIALAIALAAGMTMFAAGAAFADERAAEVEIVVKDAASGLVLASSDQSRAGDVATLSNAGPGRGVDVEVIRSDVYESGDQGVVVCEALITLPQADGNVAPCDSSGNTVVQSGVTAIVTAHYDLTYKDGSTLKYVRINRVTGTWTPSLSSIFIQGREVYAHQGKLLGGVTKEWYPTYNSFSYNTGWTDFYRIVAQSAIEYSEATSYCIASVSGMSGDYEINARVRLS